MIRPYSTWKSNHGHFFEKRVNKIGRGAKGRIQPGSERAALPEHHQTALTVSRIYPGLTLFKKLAGKISLTPEKEEERVKGLPIKDFISLPR